MPAIEHEGLAMHPALGAGVQPSPASQLLQGRVFCHLSRELVRGEDALHANTIEHGVDQRTCGLDVLTGAGDK